LDNDNRSIEKSLAKDWKNLAKEKKIYDQIRLLDKIGRERVRINYNKGNPRIVPKDQLQFKGDRYYFKDTFKLSKKRGIYISPFDLNIEKGRIERPLKPMIRFATPIFNKNKEKAGIVIINYLGKDLIKKIEKQSNDNLDKFMLVNNNGYWLYVPDRKKRWGFMFKDRKDISFKDEFNQEWNKISKNDSGQFHNQKGLFTFDTVYPLLESWITSTGSNTPFGSMVKSTTVAFALGNLPL
jgi:phage pi2 protein 07